MRRREIRDGWDRAAREDAMFNILTTPAYEGNRWPEDEFFQRGRDEIDGLLASLDVEPSGTALDFGCGVGRLTQALAAHFDRAVGVDVSAEMIARAEGFNDNPRVSFRLNDASDLAQLPTGSFDFVYSMIVLQHMPSRLAGRYVRDFIRVLRPGGLAVFQAPEGTDYIHPLPWLSMFGTPRATVERHWLPGADLIEARDSEAAPGWRSWLYIAEKRGTT